MEAELKMIRSESTTKNEKVDSAMMCWESMSNFTEEEPHKEPEKVVKKPVKKMENPTQNKLNHVFEVYEESGSDVDCIEDSLKGENKKNSKEDNYIIWMRKKEGK